MMIIYLAQIVAQQMKKGLEKKWIP